MSRRASASLDALAAAGVFLACWAAVHTWFWGHGQLVDWPTYQEYGSAIVDGRVPYRDFAVEYPPGALPVFVLPTAGADYATFFAWLMAACGVAITATLAFLDRRAAFVAALSPVLVGSLVLSRFDLWPTLLLVAALAGLLTGRHRLGWALLGAAVSAKLWPLVVVPVALVYSARRGRARAALAGAAVVVIAFVPFLLLAPHGLVESLRGQASRPLQVESLGAALVTTLGHPRIVTTHGSQNVAGHGALGTALSLVGILAVAAAWGGYARGPATRERLVRFTAAAVAGFVAFDKVLSPQYLLWLLPLVPLVRGRRGLAAAGILVAACVLTQVWFPLRYWQYVASFHLAWVVLLRDVLLVALYGVLVTPRPGRARARTT